MFSNLRKAEEEAAAEHTAVPVRQSSVVVVLKTAWICAFRGVVFGNVNDHKAVHVNNRRLRIDRSSLSQAELVLAL